MITLAQLRRWRLQPWRTFSKAEKQALHQQAEGIARFWGTPTWRLSEV